MDVPEPYTSSVVEQYKHGLQPLYFLIGVEMIIGIIANSVVLLVFGLRFEHSTYRVYVLLLGVIDLAGCLTVMPMEIAYHTLWPELMSNSFCAIKVFVNTFWRTAQGLCLLLILLDRYRKLMYPEKPEISKSRTRRKCVLVIVSSVLLALPVFVYSGQSRELIGNVELPVCDVYYNRRIDFVIYFYVALMERAIVGALLLILCYIITDLAASNPPPTDDQPHRKNAYTFDPRQTKCVIFLSTFHFVTSAFTDFSDSFIIIDEWFGFSLYFTSWFRFIYKLPLMTHAINPLIFGFLDPNFRQIIRNINFFTSSTPRESHEGHVNMGYISSENGLLENPDTDQSEMNTSEIQSESTC